MKLAGIRLLDLAANTLAFTGVMMVLGSAAGGLVLEAKTLCEVLFALGWMAIGVCMLLTLAVDRVRCPNCGKPFNRPDYRNWFRTQLGENTDAPVLRPL